MLQEFLQKLMGGAAPVPNRLAGMSAPAAMADPRQMYSPDVQAYQNALSGMSAPKGMNPINGRPILDNGDGSYSTEESITVTDPRLNGGQPTNIPSIWGGRRTVSEDEAVSAALQSGQRFSAFGSIPEAVSAAKARSDSLAPGVPGGQSPQPAPMAAPAPAQGGGIGGFLGNIFNPGGAGRNQTVQWLQTQGMDEGMATLMAGNKNALQNYLLQRSQGQKPIEVNGRLVDPNTFEVVADFSDKTQPNRPTSVIDGKLVDTNTGEVVGDYGAPDPKAPTVQKLTLEDGSEMAVQWDGDSQQWVPLDAPTGGATITPKNKLTESQSKLTLFQSLQTETQPVLLDLEAQFNPGNLQDAAARNTPIAGNFFQTQEGQMYNAAATAWAEGALRIATGAAATPEEMERTKKAYFAQPGDTPLTVAFKAQMREMYNRAVQRGLGENVDATLPKPSEFIKQAAGAATTGKADRVEPSPERFGRNRTSSGVQWSIEE